jgi:hypothetical protein
VYEKYVGEASVRYRDAQDAAQAERLACGKTQIQCRLGNGERPKKNAPGRCRRRFDDGATVSGANEHEAGGSFQGGICGHRSSRWGNPFDWRVMGPEVAIREYELALLLGALPLTVANVGQTLSGRPLGCYCPLVVLVT